MKLTRKTFQIMALAGFLLGISPDAQATPYSKIIALGSIAASVSYWMYLKYQATQPEPRANTPNQTQVSHKTVVYKKTVGKTHVEVSFEKIYESDEETQYKMIINNLDKYENYAKFTVYKKRQVGSLHTLAVGQNERQKNYGALLYACVIKAMIDFGCTEITWYAAPNNLLNGQTPEQMLPKLINFYQQLGAQATTRYSTSAVMILNDLNKAREGIYKILEQWESKSAVEKNNALNRASMIVNHVNPTQLTVQPASGKQEKTLVKNEKIYSKQTKELIGKIKIEPSSKNSNSITFTAELNNAEKQVIGDATFTFNTQTKEATIELIDIDSNQRGKGYGKLMLAHIGQFLLDNGCKKASGLANPFDPSEGKTQENTLPGLINFYKKFGAQVTNKTETEAGMELNNTEKIQKQINKIISKF